MTMEEINQTINFKKVVLIGAIVIGLIFLYHEIVFWRNFSLMKGTFQAMGNEVTQFQQDFLAKAEEMNKRGERLKKKFDEREMKFHERFRTFGKVEQTKDEEIQKRSEALKEEAVKTLVEMINYNYEHRDDAVEKKYQFLNEKLDAIHDKALVIKNMIKKEMAKEENK